MKDITDFFKAGYKRPNPIHSAMHFCQFRNVTKGHREEDMSLSIDIDNLPNWSAIFSEIERQENLKVFAVMEPANDINNQQRTKKN